MKKIRGKWLGIGLAVIVALPYQAKTEHQITYNGEKIYLDQEIVQVENSILLPLRTISQYLGYDVNWYQDTKKIEIIYANTTIALWIDRQEAEINGEKVELAVPPKIINGSTYVPLRFVGEALNLEVNWDGQTKTVRLEGKYIVDVENKKLIVKTLSGKQILADIHTLEGIGKEGTSVKVTSKITKNGSEIVTVSETLSGALTGYTSTDFYIKNGKIIDQLERSYHYIGEVGIAYYQNQIAFCNTNDLRIYDDQTGALVKRYNLEDFKEGFRLDLMKLGKNYVMGRYQNTIHVVDLETGRVTRVLDLISQQDQGYVFQGDSCLEIDDIELVWETEDALVFKYYSITDKVEKTVNCILGK